MNISRNCVTGAGLARRGYQETARAAMAATVVVVLNFIINYHVQIKYFGWNMNISINRL